MDETRSNRSVWHTMTTPKLPSIISRVRSLPVDMPALAEVAEANGFFAVRRLVDAWRSGANTFDGPGEALFVARLRGQLIGCCGLNTDPYVSSPTIGRVRHLFVHGGYRRRGIATRLLGHVIQEAERTFDLLRLRAQRADADAFYRANGFVRVESETCTHALTL